ncbi:MAG: hypothetical protein M1831_003705 [Alyxoria varia]|nr:MAG: hypothetical protein M1831_003705 [Alyxoria varia]
MQSQRFDMPKESSPSADTTTSSSFTSSRSDPSQRTRPFRFSHSTSSPPERTGRAIPLPKPQDNIADGSTVHVHYTAQGLEDQLREFAKETGSDGYFECTIKPQEFIKLSDRIDRLPSGDELKGFWEELRFEYDSAIQSFWTFMGPPSRVHEKFLVAVSEQVNGYLRSLRESEIKPISDFAFAVHEERSSDIRYESRKDANYADPASNTSSASSSAVRESPVGTRSRSASTKQRDFAQTTPSDASLAGSCSVSFGSDLETVCKHFSPDNSWRFQSARAEDKFAALVLEVQKRQPDQKLEAKIKGLIEHCNAQSVLICKIQRPKTDSACIELWRLEDESPHLQWSIELLDERGEVPLQHEQEALLHLEEFISDETSAIHFNERVDEYEQLLEKCEPLSFGIEELATTLQQLRNKERQWNDQIVKAGKRPRDSGNVDCEVDEDEPEIKRRIREHRKRRYVK